MDDDSEHKKAKGTKKKKKKKKCIIKRIIMVKNYEDCLLSDKIILKSQQKIKNNYHEVYTEEVNKIALSSNNDKRLQKFDKVKTYQHGTNAFIVCESEMMTVTYFFVKNYVDCPFYDEIILQQR